MGFFSNLIGEELKMVTLKWIAIPFKKHCWVKRKTAVDLRTSRLR
jgi:hypothetical protein